MPPKRKPDEISQPAALPVADVNVSNKQQKQTSTVIDNFQFVPAKVLRQGSSAMVIDNSPKHVEIKVSLFRNAFPLVLLLIFRLKMIILST
jgi:hypothetical protein